MYKKSLHIFRRDLRLNDNTALIEALKKSEQVITAFILDKRQLENNPYRSDNLVEFMFNSLKDLDQQLKEHNSKLYLFHGLTEDIIEKIIKNEKIDSIFINKDYTPFSLKRDKKIEDICKKNKIAFEAYDDALLNPPKSILKDDKKPYTVFTAFYKKALNLEVKKPVKNNYKNYYKKDIKDSISFSIENKILENKNKNLLVKGGREEALELLKKLNKLEYYTEERNYPDKPTTHLSAHNKFGTVSIREVYWEIEENLGRHSTLLVELYWRDFFTHIGYHFPEVLGSSFNEKYDKLTWSKDKHKFEAWCSGKTGFPIVDAGMRELNSTGFMHNRVRMIVASFLVKDLHIDWRWGEKYFAQKLTDYDPLVNNGNWQWAASTGCDAQPYFRIFNPWLQQEKFDSSCKYIKKWIPELKDLSAEEIHNLQNLENNNINYPKPIVNHSEEAKLAIKYYKEI